MSVFLDVLYINYLCVQRKSKLMFLNTTPNKLDIIT
ncbi:MAG: hypothetical protein ACI870_000110 [Crocinitomicaceae bacterium]|jgi:hypothetical protein